MRKKKWKKYTIPRVSTVLVGNLSFLGKTGTTQVLVFQSFLVTVYIAHGFTDCMHICESFSILNDLTEIEVL